MLWVPRNGVYRMEDNLGDAGTSTPGTSVTTGASEGTKGTAVQLIAATAFDAYWITVLAHSYSAAATASECCLDILIGAATEAVLIPDLLAGGCGSPTSNQFKRWDFPLLVPAGSRIAAQAAGNRTSTALRVAVILHGGDGYPPFEVGTRVTTYGVTVPDGIAITAGASGAAGSWTEIEASTDEDHIALVPSFQSLDDTNIQGRMIWVDMGVGASSAERRIGENYLFSTGSTETVHGPINNMPAFGHIPATSRLVMRASCSGTVDAYTGAIHAVS
jgi:hypothetical protein